MMSRILWRSAMLLCVVALAVSGCNEREDTRSTEEKMDAPRPDFKTRLYMACPKCGCPQRPYRITEIKDYYRCSGNPPKFPYHTEHLWQHTVNRKEGRRTEI
jgi:hypothetical protein